MTEDIDSATDSAVITKVNVDPKVLERHRYVNRNAGWPCLGARWSGLSEVAIIGGGPSLATTRTELDTLVARKIPLVTVNGAYRWTTDHHLHPAIQIVMDAREHNARFTHPIWPGTRFLIADTCHPDVLKGLSKLNTHIWTRESLVGGSTVMLSAISLMVWMGATSLHLFGLDSCFSGDQHHAYPQPENDPDPLIKVDVDGRLFHTTPWMVLQAEEFMDLSPQWGTFKVYGDGMIAHIVQCSKE
jgi:hypothetical protein